MFDWFVGFGFVVCFGGVYFICLLFVVFGWLVILLIDVSSQNGDRQYLAQIEPILTHAFLFSLLFSLYIYIFFSTWQKC